MSEYNLKTGKAGEAQLDNLDRFYGPSSREFLKRIGVREGMVVADVGCGVGHISFWLAEQVGAHGHVHAVDFSADQIDVAKRRAKECGINNISFHVLDARDLSRLNGQMDLAYCRWLLVHVPNPVSVIESMTKTLKPGGLLACEVGHRNCSFTYPVDDAYDKVLHLATDLLVHSGCDAHVAYHVLDFVKAQNVFEEIDFQFYQPVVTDKALMGNFQQSIGMLLESLWPRLVESGLISEAGLQAIKTDLKAANYHRCSFIAVTRITQLCARKKL